MGCIPCKRELVVVSGVSALLAEDFWEGLAGEENQTNTHGAELAFVAYMYVIRLDGNNNMQGHEDIYQTRFMTTVLMFRWIN